MSCSKERPKVSSWFTGEWQGISGEMDRGSSIGSWLLQLWSKIQQLWNMLMPHWGVTELLGVFFTTKLSVWFFMFFFPPFSCTNFCYYFFELHFLVRLEGSIQGCKRAIDHYIHVCPESSRLCSIWCTSSVATCPQDFLLCSGIVPLDNPTQEQTMSLLKTTEWCFCWEWGDNLEHTLNVNLVGNTETQHLKNSQSAKKRHQHTTSPFAGRCLFGVESPAWIH